MSTTYTELHIYYFDNVTRTNIIVETVLLHIDMNHMVIAAYLMSEPTKDVLVPLTAGTFIREYNDSGYVKKVYNSGLTLYSNMYIPQRIYSSDGILLSSLGHIIDNAMIKSLQNNTQYPIGTFKTGDILQYNIGAKRYYDITSGVTRYFTLQYNYSFIDNVSCFCEDTQILCADGTTESIQNLTPGTLVQTLRSGPKQVVTVGRRVVNEFNKSNRVQDRVYTYKDSGLQITGKHCVLVDGLTELQEDRVSKIFGFVKMIEGKYALPVWLDNKAQFVLSENEVSLYHIVLENEEEREAYGVCANGVWAESCSAYDFEKYSGMVPINI